MKPSYIAMIGGALLVIGVFLPWATVSMGPFSASASGINAWQGVVDLIMGLALIVGGVLLLKATGGTGDAKKDETVEKVAAVLGGAIGGMLAGGKFRAAFLSAAGIAAVITVWAFLRVLTASMVGLGFGLIICLIGAAGGVWAALQVPKTQEV
jgi:hypothetical protein